MGVLSKRQKYILKELNKGIHFELIEGLDFDNEIKEMVNSGVIMIQQYKLFITSKGRNWLEQNKTE